MKTRILVVDDEPDFTHLLKLSLEAAGYYEVMEENDPGRTVVAAREFDPDLIVLDVMMPDMDGSEVVDRLKRDPVMWDVPVMFMTALVTADDAPAGSCDRGGHTFLPKNIPLERLIDCIETKIRRPVAVPA